MLQHARLWRMLAATAVGFAASLWFVPAAWAQG
jgi:hypothetical protein